MESRSKKRSLLHNNYKLTIILTLKEYHLLTKSSHIALESINIKIEVKLKIDYRPMMMILVLFIVIFYGK